MKKKILAAAACFFLWNSTCSAIDGASFEAGSGQGSTRVARFGVQWNWQTKWFAQNRWQLGGYWDAQVGMWDNRAGPGSLADLSLTPVFRLAAADSPVYFEGAIGFHYLSDYPSRGGSAFATRFQFGDHLGVGVRFGERRAHDLSVRLQHVSNAGIKNPNPGINLILARYQHHF
ncbi:MAG: acyloxyacyl hydrolase [Betaproteobacteria bacterium]